MRDSKSGCLFSLIYTEWNNNISKIRFNWERRTTFIYKKVGSGLKYVTDHNDGSVTVSAGFLDDDSDYDD